MKRRATLRRKASLKAKTPNARRVGVKKRNAKRKAAETLRAYGPAERREWIKNQPCAACGRGPCVNAHTVTGGAGRKADARTIIPLCVPCHQKQHDKGWDAVFVGTRWENLARFRGGHATAQRAADQVETEWQRHLATTARRDW